MTNSPVDVLADELVVRVSSLDPTPAMFGRGGGNETTIKDVLTKAFRAGVVQGEENAARGTFPFPRNAFPLPAGAPPLWTPFEFGRVTGQRARAGTFSNLPEANEELGFLRDRVLDLLQAKGNVALPTPEGARTGWTPFPYSYMAREPRQRGRRGTMANLPEANREIGFIRERIMDLQALPDLHRTVSLEVQKVKAASFANGKREGRAELAREMAALRSQIDELEDSAEELETELDDLIDQPNKEPASTVRDEQLRGMIT